MTLNQLSVSPEFPACPKRNRTSSDPLKSRWHTAEPILRASATIPFDVPPSGSGLGGASLLSRSRFLSRLSHHFLGTKCRLFPRKSLISHFPPQIFGFVVPPCPHKNAHAALLQFVPIRQFTISGS